MTAKASSGGGSGGGEGGWKSDHEWVNRPIRRRILEPGADGDTFVDGVITGWLSAKESDFEDSSGTPAPLWHVRYTSGSLAGDEEDLERHEVEESILPLDVAAAAGKHQRKPKASGKEPTASGNGDNPKAVGGRSGKKSSAKNARGRPSAREDDSDEWQQDHDWVGAKVRRKVVEDDKTGMPSIVEGKVICWLSAENSNYDDKDGKPAALWRVKYTTGVIAGELEDFEEHDILASLHPRPNGNGGNSQKRQRKL
uniref:Uncharacterized protein n=1 Tax=Rhizochromulina marina TaxID=1034831 RepID=A0A7S2WSB3_9STRA